MGKKGRDKGIYLIAWGLHMYTPTRPASLASLVVTNELADKQTFIDKTDIQTQYHIQNRQNTTPAYSKVN